MADFSRRRNHEFLTKLYKHHYVYLMHLIHNWIDSRLPQIYRSIPRVISNIIGNRVKGSILSFEDQDRLFRRGWKKVVSRVSERLNGIIKQEHRHGRDPRKATDRDYDPGAWRRPDPRKESVVLRNNLERIRRQETNPPPCHFSRVRDSFHDSIASIARPLIGRRPTPSTILRTRIVATPSIFLRGIPAQYTNLYFSFGRTIAASRLADQSWIATMTIAELKSRECRKSGRKPSTGQKLPCRAIVADSWNERKSPRLCFHARNVRFLLGVSIRSDKLEHDPSQYWYRAGGGAVMSGVALFSSPSLSLSLSPSRDAQQGEREREWEEYKKRIKGGKKEGRKRR